MPRLRPRPFSLLLLAAAAAAQGAAAALHGAGLLRGQGFVRSLEFRHHLRVCNAYPYAAALDVHRGKESLTDGEPMPYKTCREFMAPLKAGDRLEFVVGGTGAGTFAVHELPSNDAVLLLVIYRHDTLSTAVSFESHVFAKLLNAQIAVIDTYRGSARSTPRIMDAESTGSTSSRSEELRYNSVVAVNPGIYQVVLAGADGEIKAKSALVALNRESYVVLRTGVEAQQGPSFPQELVVYPRSSVAALLGAAMAARQHLLALALALLASATAGPRVGSLL